MSWEYEKPPSNAMGAFNPARGVGFDSKEDEMLENVEKLRTAGRNMAKGRNLENHEECNLLLIIADEIEREIAEKYLEKPLDEDGKVINIGDELEFYGDTFTVAWIDYEETGVYVGKAYMDGKIPDAFSPDECRHVKPDPLKELLSELANEVWEASCTCQTTWSDSGLDGIEERYAERIRDLLGGDAE